jgi:hypothetical protein
MISPTSSPNKANMKMKILSVLCVAVLGPSTATPAVARTDPDAAFFDVILGRPVGLAATVAGGVAFVVSLPATCVFKGNFFYCHQPSGLG